ncbi:hypothetical protein [Kingella kingae]|uniref:hypothetical protein n=1 Tax=Kingella kingae TaxID=504 RepID=UPI000424EBEA|nr:hypothetical protein [Kingella kingae]
MRQENEKWQRCIGNDDRLQFDEAEQQYEDISIDYAWQGWQAAQQTVPTPQPHE